MRKRIHKILSALCLSLLCLTARAEYHTNSWNFVLTPYLWIVNLNGTSGVNGLNVPLHQGFIDVFSDPSFAGALYFEARQNHIAIFLDTVLSKMTNSGDINGISASLTNEYAIFTPGLTYRAIDQDTSDDMHFIFDPYVGIRITRNNTTVEYLGLNTNNNQYWGDAILGAKLSFRFYKALTLDLIGDLGGTTSNNQRSYNLIAAFGYQIPNVVYPIRILAAYRYLHQTYVINNFDWEMGIFGPMAGVEIKF